MWNLCCGVIKYLLTYQPSKLFHFVDQRPQSNSTIGLSETAECTTTYVTTQQGIVNNSNTDIIMVTIFHQERSEIQNWNVHYAIYWFMIYMYIYTLICLYTYIRIRNIRSSSFAYLWRNICTVVFVSFIFLNNVTACNVCYCKFLQFDVRFALCVW